MKKQYAVLVIIVFACLSATTLSAGESTKQKKLVELMHVMGVKQSFKDDYQLCLKQAESYSPRNINSQQPEYFGGITPKDPLWKEIVASYESHVKAICSCVSEEEYIHILASSYGRYVTENEIDAILKFLRTPIGQKEIYADLMTKKQVGEYIVKKMNAVESKEYTKYMAELDRIISKHQKK